MAKSGSKIIIRDRTVGFDMCAAELLPINIAPSSGVPHCSHHSPPKRTAAEGVPVRRLTWVAVFTAPDCHGLHGTGSKSHSNADQNIAQRVPLLLHRNASDLGLLERLLAGAHTEHHEGSIGHAD